MEKGCASMVRIREILALDPLAGFELLAGAGGLDNVLTNVTILDYETDSMDFSAFQKGDFILTSLFFAKDAPQLIVDAFRELLRRGIAGIAVKTVFYKTLPCGYAAACGRNECACFRIPCSLYGGDHSRSTFLHACKRAT